MTQMYRTLRIVPSGKGVLGVVIDVPPMNLIGPELVRDLVTLLGALESGQETRVVVLESADPDYFVTRRGRHAAPGPAAGTGPGHGGDSRRGRLRRRRTVRLGQPGPARC
jgi:enoyl-CoA hydratase/carnithine racemase